MPLLSPGQFFRMLHINWVLMRHGLDDIVFATHLFRPFRFIIYLFPWNWFRRKRKPRAVRMREALEDLGPIFIKFGQMLSTRRDLLADDIADELQRLQDNVPEFPGNQARKIIEKAFGQNTDDLFETFDEQPLASASIAQVHAAVLNTGEDVIVKVLRPDILPVIKRDISLLYIIAELAARYSSQLRRLRPVEVIEEYEKTILDELDLLREAANASQLRRNFEGSSDLYVPEVHWDYTRHQVFVMERIHGVPVTDLDRLRAAGTDLKLLAERGVEIFFTQVFRDSFFHADMHPGNIFVDASDPADPTYIAVDCAIVGSLSDSDQYYLARNLLAIFQRDYREVAQLHVECGWVPPQTRVQDFESAMRAVCEPIFERPLSEISFGELLVYLFRTAGRFDMEVQPSLVLLQKTLLNIEGLGRQLYPELNLWDTAQPFLEEWVQERYSPQSVLKRLQRHAPSWLEQLPQLPDVVMDSLQQSREIEQRFTQQQRHMNELQQQSSNRVARQRRYTVAAIACIAAAVSVFPGAWQQLSQAPLISWLLGALALGLLWPRVS